MIDYYEMARRNYERGLWTAAMLRVLVRKAQITREQYEEITGEAY